MLKLLKKQRWLINISHEAALFVLALGLFINNFSLDKAINYPVNS